MEVYVYRHAICPPLRLPECKGAASHEARSHPRHDKRKPPEGGGLYLI